MKKILGGFAPTIQYVPWNRTGWWLVDCHPCSFSPTALSTRSEAEKTSLVHTNTQSHIEFVHFLDEVVANQP